MAALVSTPALRSAILECQVSNLVVMDLWAWAECAGCSANRELELQPLAASHPGAKFGDLLPRLRCSSCDARPSKVAVLDVRGRQIVLLDAGEDGGLVQAPWVKGHPREMPDVGQAEVRAGR